MLPFFYILATPILAEWISGIDMIAVRKRIRTNAPMPGEQHGTSKLANKVLVLILLLAALMSIPYIRDQLWGSARSTAVSSYFPSGAADYLESTSQKGTRLFNMAEWGGYLIWRLHPQTQVFLDGRIELYPESVWRDYLSIVILKDNWLHLLCQHQVDYLILSKERHGALIEAAHAAGIKQDFEDNVSTIFNLGSTCEEEDP
jgi:hypothetical protein